MVKTAKGRDLHPKCTACLGQALAKLAHLKTAGQDRPDCARRSFTGSLQDTLNGVVGLATGRRGDEEGGVHQLLDCRLDGQHAGRRDFQVEMTIFILDSVLDRLQGFWLVEGVVGVDFTR